jgi:hypothetical protein
MKKILPSFLVALVLLTGVSKFALADGTNVNLIVKNNGDVVYSGSVTLLPVGTISINDSSGKPHDTNADSVLSIINTTDASSGEFNISNLIYYDLFGAFYLKCINVSGTDLCDNWQYKVDEKSPDVGMDSKILSGGENVALYFGDENKAPEPTPTPTPTPVPETPPAHRSSGSYIIPPQIISPPETTPLPLFSPIPTETTSPPLNTNLKEKIQPVLSPAPKKQTKKVVKKVQNLASQNTATVINSVSTPPLQPTQNETPKKGWFRNLLDKIFSIF